MTSSNPGLFPLLMGDDWEHLSTSVKRMLGHAERLVAQGLADVEDLSIGSSAYCDISLACPARDDSSAWKSPLNAAARMKYGRADSRPSACVPHFTAQLIAPLLSEKLGACRALAVEAKIWPCEDRFWAIRRPIVMLWAKSRRKLWTTWPDLQPGQLKSDRLLGMITLRFALTLHHESVDGQLQGARWFGLPMPRFLFGKVMARCASENGRYTFQIDTRLPLLGQLVAYCGWLEIVDEC